MIRRVDASTDDLTPREYEVLTELVRGKSNKGIGKTLVISEATVEVHLNRVYRKLRVSSRTEAVIYALTHGIGMIQPK